MIAALPVCIYIRRVEFFRTLHKTPLVRWLAGPKPIIFCMPWLMLLLVIGTVSQRYIGLYEAERLFFTSWLVWIGPVPLPGLYPVLGLLALGLLAKLMAPRYWSRRMAGSLLTHLGAFALLLGGLITAMTASEGYMMIAEGSQSQAVSDYHKRELIAFKQDAPLWRVAHDNLRKDANLSEGLPFSLKVEESFRHSLPVPVETPKEDARGFAQQAMLQKAPLRKEDEENMAGLVLRVSGTNDPAYDGQYILFEPMPQRAVIVMNGMEYAFDLRRHQRGLPFHVALKNFEKITYPGSDKAEEFQSHVTIIDEDGTRMDEWIRMNEPLRTHGYTLYQSSYMEIDGKQHTILAVVKNHGFLFPYIATIMMALGLLIQSAQRIARGKT
jgi:energy-converting hydrogenase Eha subunit C